MVNLGLLASDKRIPSPELSYVRLFQDDSIGWQFKGQYAIWTGASTAGGPRYRLLKRFGNRVGAIEYPDGRTVLHRITAGMPFLVEGLMRYWLTFDSDAMRLDTPCPEGRYALLAIGGSAGKPGQAVLDWTCPRCGEDINPHTLDIRPRAFDAFLGQVEILAADFDADADARTCGHCSAIHPTLDALTQADDEATRGDRS